MDPRTSLSPGSSYRKAQAALCLGQGVCLPPRLGREVWGPPEGKSSSARETTVNPALLLSSSGNLGSAAPPTIVLARKMC